MAETTKLAELLMLIDTQRQRAERAHRLVHDRKNEAAHRSLLDYASELDAQVEKLEAEAAVMKQAANDDQPIAAIKPESKPDSKN